MGTRVSQIPGQNYSSPRGYLVSAGERDGPSLEAADELLAGDVSLRVPYHAPGDDEREDPRATAVRQLRESVQQGHHRISRAQLNRSTITPPCPSCEISFTPLPASPLVPCKRQFHTFSFFLFSLLFYRSKAVFSPFFCTISNSFLYTVCKVMYSR